MEAEVNSNRYSYTDIAAILRQLQGNGFNYLKTAREAGITRKTLKAWEKKYGHEVFSKSSPREAALAEIDAEMKQNDINIIRYLYSIRKRTLHKISLMAEDETRIEPLLSVLKYVSAEIDKYAEMEKSEPKPSGVDFIIKLNEDLKRMNQQRPS